MGILRLTLLVSIAATAFAQQPSRDVLASTPTGSPVALQTSTVENNNSSMSQPGTTLTATRAAKDLLRERADFGTCYFIRSYVMKREDDTDATHLDHVTTCTPISRFQMKKTVHIVPALAK